MNPSLTGRLWVYINGRRLGNTSAAENLPQQVLVDALSLGF